MAEQFPGLRLAYRDLIVEGLDRIITTQSDVLTSVRDAIADALAADRIIYVAGSGHSHMLAEEVFYRAGGIAAAQAILDPDLMLHQGATRSTQMERESGRAATVLARYPLGQGDVLVIASNSGRNAYPIELALLAREQGATTVALTSLTHSRQSSSRHNSGKRLFEIAEHVIDNGGDYGDSALSIPGRRIKMGPTSTIMGVFILNALLAEAVALLAKRNIEVDVFQSANSEGAQAQLATDALIEKWRHRIIGF